MEPLLPIAEISSYHSRWTIKARITTKSQLRRFSKGTGDGKLFSVDLLDKENGEIRATFFNDAVDRFFDSLQVGKCYMFSRGSVKIANRQFNSCNHRYELTFDKLATATEVEDDVEIKTMQFSFVDFRAVQSKTLPHKADLCGVIVGVNPVLSFTSRDGKELVKREITIADDTASSIDVTLWGELAKEPDAKFEGKPVVGMKGVLLKEWNGGRAGSLSEGSNLVFEIQSPEAERIRQWWVGGGMSQTLTPLSVSGGGGGAARNAKGATLADLRKATERLPDQPENFNVVTRLALVQTRKRDEVQPLTYLACTQPRPGSGLLCNKRVDETGFCAGCGQVVKPVARMNLRCRFADFGDSAWLTTFHEGAERVLGMTAEEVRALEQEAFAGGEEARTAFEDRLKLRYFLGTPFQVTVRSKADSYNGEARTNVSCIDARPVQRGEHGRKMLSEIHEMLAAAAGAGA